MTFHLGGEGPGVLSIFSRVQVLEQAWPFFGMFMEKLLRENIQPAVRQSNPALKTFNFTKVHFGHVVSLDFSSSCLDS